MVEANTTVNDYGNSFQVEDKISNSLGMVIHMENLSSERVRVEDCHEFETSLIYIGSTRLDLTEQDPVSENGDF